jgi:hypothetical protein
VNHVELAAAVHVELMSGVVARAGDPGAGRRKTTTRRRRRRGMWCCLIAIVASVCRTGQPRAQHQFIDEFHGQQAVFTNESVRR